MIIKVTGTVVTVREMRYEACQSMDFARALALAEEKFREDMEKLGFKVVKVEGFDRED